jgi:hypothetical protein
MSEHQKELPLKTARIESAISLTVVCEACDTCCENANGAGMITDDFVEAQIVYCPNCGTSYQLPGDAFQVVSQSKCIEVRKKTALLEPGLK